MSGATHKCKERERRKGEKKERREGEKEKKKKYMTEIKRLQISELFINSMALTLEGIRRVGANTIPSDFED